MFLSYTIVCCILLALAIVINGNSDFSVSWLWLLLIVLLVYKFYRMQLGNLMAGLYLLVCGYQEATLSGTLKGYQILKVSWLTSTIEGVDKATRTVTNCEVLEAGIVRESQANKKEVTPSEPQ